MKDQGVKIAVIVMVGLIVCSWILSDGLKSLGTSIELAGSSIGHGTANSGSSAKILKQPVRVELGTLKLRLSSGDRGDGAFRVESTVREVTPLK